MYINFQQLKNGELGRMSLHFPVLQTHSKHLLSTYFGFFIERFLPPSDRLVLSHKRKLRVNILRIIFAMVSGDIRPSMCPLGAKRMPFCVVGSMRHE